MKSIQLFSRMALFLALMILSAYIQITLPTPFMPMHITMQLFTAILCGFCLPNRYAFLCMFTYILVGLLGFPVFASGGGLQYIMKPTFGFVLGFLACSTICAIVYKRKSPVSLKEYFLVGLTGLISFYVVGNIYYYFSFPILMNTRIPLWLSLINGFLVSIIPDILICFLACKVAKTLQILIK